MALLQNSFPTQTEGNPKFLYFNAKEIGRRRQTASRRPTLSPIHLQPDVEVCYHPATTPSGPYTFTPPCELAIFTRVNSFAWEGRAVALKLTM